MRRTSYKVLWIIFGSLGLTQAERNEVYWSVSAFVKNRLEKARSG